MGLKLMLVHSRFILYTTNLVLSKKRPIYFKVRKKYVRLQLDIHVRIVTMLIYNH